jgi:hypothetical protein
MAGEGDTRPVPDPTALTTKAVDTAVAVAKEFTIGEVTHLKELTDVQFGLIERQRKEQKEDTKAAVDAALAAAKEAVKEQTTASQLSTNKSETSFAEQLKQQNVTFSVAIEGVNREMRDLKTRVERIENLKQGGQDSKASVYAAVGLGVLVLGLLGTIVAIVISLK